MKRSYDDLKRFLEGAQQLQSVLQRPIVTSLYKYCTIKITVQNPECLLGHPGASLARNRPPPYSSSTREGTLLQSASHGDFSPAAAAEGAGRVARLFSFALTDPGVRLSRTRLFPRVTVIGSHLRPCENDPRTGKGKAPFQSQEPIPSFASAFLAPSPKAIEPDAPNLVKE